METIQAGEVWVDCRAVGRQHDLRSAGLGYVVYNDGTIWEMLKCEVCPALTRIKASKGLGQERP